MYKIKRRSTKNIIGIKLSGILTREAYAEIVSILEKKIKEYGKIRILIELDHWEGWGPYAALKDIAFVFKNSFKIDRIGFIVKSKADKQAVLLDQPFSPWFGDHTRYFAGKEKAAAWAWIEEGVVESEVDQSVSSASKLKVRYGPKMKVLIIGGSVSGLTLGALLEQRGFRPTIVEAKESTVDDPNIGILSPAVTGTLKSLGFYKKVKKAATPFDRSVVLDKEGNLLQSYDIEQMFQNHGSCLAIPKNDLLQLVRLAVSHSNLKMSVAATKLNKTAEGMEVNFSDGTKEVYDCVVCCDGVSSKMRELIFGRSEPAYSGMLGWAYSIEPDFDVPKKVTEFRSEGGFIRIYPNDEDVYVLAGLRAEESQFDPLTKNIDLLKNSFKTLPSPVPQILEALETDEHLWHSPLYSLKNDEWVEDRVALLGDSAFSFLPHTILGSTLNLFTLESAFVLAEELSRSDSNHLPNALATYETRRHRRVTEIHKLLAKYNLESFALSGDFTRGQPASQEDLANFWHAVLVEPI